MMLSRVAEPTAVAAPLRRPRGEHGDLPGTCAGRLKPQLDAAPDHALAAELPGGVPGARQHISASRRPERSRIRSPAARRRAAWSCPAPRRGDDLQLVSGTCRQAAWLQRRDLPRWTRAGGAPPPSRSRPSRRSALRVLTGCLHHFRPAASAEAGCRPARPRCTMVPSSLLQHRDLPAPPAAGRNLAGPRPRFATRGT